MWPGARAPLFLADLRWSPDFLGPLWKFPGRRMEGRQVNWFEGWGHSFQKTNRVMPNPFRQQTARGGMSAGMDAAAGMRCVHLAGISAMAAVALLCVSAQQTARPAAVAQLQRQPGAGLRWGSVWAGREQMLWGGPGKVTTGDYVDGRPTTPGLHTDCEPGVLFSDCSPAQEDGAWSTQAAEYIDDHTGGAHSHTMERLQANVDRAFKAKDDYLAACLKDWRNCNRPAAEVRPCHLRCHGWRSLLLVQTAQRIHCTHTCARARTHR